LSVVISTDKENEFELITVLDDLHCVFNLYVDPTYPAQSGVSHAVNCALSNACVLSIR